MESKIDYITLTLKSDTKPFEEALNMLCYELLFNDLMKKMVPKGRAGFYDHHLTYENIEFLFTEPERFPEQGLCIKISSEGLDYFIAYLNSYGTTLREWLSKWRALAFRGYITKCTRWDYALDDITKNGDTPLITLSKLFRCVDRGEICKKARTIDILSGAEISSRERIKYCDGKPIKGRTLYLGVRQSGKLVRFYDKLAEQIQRKRSVPSDVTSWTRCEIEFHDNHAMSVLNAFIDYSDDAFSDYMRGVVNDTCRFINRDNDNISRCSVKRWWTAFLNGCTSCFKLPHKKPARSALARAERGLAQYSRIILTMYKVMGLEFICQFFKRQFMLLKLAGKTPYKDDLAENLLEDFRDYEKMTAEKYYLYNSDQDEKKLIDRIADQWEYGLYRYKYPEKGEFAERHKIFMTGQEVLF